MKLLAKVIQIIIYCLDRMTVTYLLQGKKTDITTEKHIYYLPSYFFRALVTIWTALPFTQLNNFKKKYPVSLFLFYYLAASKYSPV